MDGPQLLQWLENRLKEERETLERQHAIVLAQMQEYVAQEDWSISKGILCRLG